MEALQRLVQSCMALEWQLHCHDMNDFKHAVFKHAKSDATLYIKLVQKAYDTQKSTEVEKEALLFFLDHQWISSMKIAILYAGRSLQSLGRVWSRKQIVSKYAPGHKSRVLIDTVKNLILSSPGANFDSIRDLVGQEFDLPDIGPCTLVDLEERSMLFKSCFYEQYWTTMQVMTRSALLSYKKVT